MYWCLYQIYYIEEYFYMYFNVIKKNTNEYYFNRDDVLLKCLSSQNIVWFILAFNKTPIKEERWKLNTDTFQVMILHRDLNLK